MGTEAFFTFRSTICRHVCAEGPTRVQPRRRAGPALNNLTQILT